MTVQLLPTTITYTASAGQTSFPVPFGYVHGGDIAVYRDGVLQVGGFALVGSDIVLTTPAGASEAIRLDLAVVPQRLTDLPIAGPLRVDMLNGDLDRLMALAQQQQDRMAYLQTIATGVPVSDWTLGLLDDPDVATARATLGLAGLVTTDLNGAVSFPWGTGAQRPASPSAGMVRFNTESTRLECFQRGSWMTVGTGMTLLNFATVTTPVAAVEFIDLSGFSSVLLVIEAASAAGAGSWYARYYVGGGLDDSANYAYHFDDLLLATSTPGSATGQTAIRLTASASGGRNLSGQLWLQGVDHADDAKFLRSEISYWGSNLARSWSHGFRAGSTGPVTGLRLYSAGGDITAGRFSLYGVV